MAKEISDKEILINVITKNTEALTKQTDILNNINNQINNINNQLTNTITQYGNFDKNITVLKTYLKVLIGIGGAIFVSFLAGLVIYVLK